MRRGQETKRICAEDGAQGASQFLWTIRLRLINTPLQRGVAIRPGA